MKRMLCTLMTLVTVLSLGLSSAAAGKLSSFPENTAQNMAGKSYSTSAAGFLEGKYQSFFQGILIGKLPSFGPGNDTGNGPSSNPGNAEEKEPSSGQGSTVQKCSVPTEVKVEGTGTLQSRKIRVSWKAVEGADHYILQRSTSEDFSEEGSDEVKDCMVDGTTKLFYITSGGNAVYYYPAVRTYYFRVKAVCGNCESDWSEVVISEGCKDKILPF